MTEDAVEGTTGSHTLSLDDMLRQGVAAAKAGQRERARELLMRVVDLDERNATAWLWLSGVVDSLDDREICMENVLTIDPDNAAARRGLELVRQQKASQAVSADMRASPLTSSPVAMRLRVPVSPASAILQQDFSAQPLPESEPVSVDQVPEPPVVARTRTPVSPASAMLQEDFASQRPAQQPEIAPPPVQIVDEFGDEYLCPYCAISTEPDDRRCKSCGGKLWIQFRKREKRSKLLWTLIGFQAFNTMILAVPPLFVYLGMLSLESILPELGAEAMDAALPAWAITLVTLMAAIPFLLSLGLLAGLYLCWKPVYYLLLVNAVIELLLALVSFGLVEGIAPGLIGIGMAAVTAVLTLQLGADFETERRRILLRLDRGLKSGPDYLARGNLYNQRRMWGLSAIHLRMAAGLMPVRLDVQAMLATTYIRLGRYDSAERVVAKAEEITPDDQRVRGLRTLLDELRAGEGPA
jgi:tetratricopeptide (TPR) repeat protein